MIQNPKSRTILFYLDGVLQGSTKPYNQSVPSISRDLLGEGAINVNGAKVQITECKLYDYAVNEDVILADYKTVDAMGRYVCAYKDGETELDLPYRVYLPSDYDPESNKKYPMLFFLHGHGETGMDNTQNVRVNGGENKLLKDLIARDNIIIVAPQVTCDDGGDREWINSNAHKWAQGSRASLPEDPTTAMSAAMALLDEYLACGKVDTSRVYAGGISMGGYGTWELITRRSEVFAAAIPLCGAGIPSEAAKLTDIAIWAFHGDRDDTVPPSGSRDMYNAILAAGGQKVRYTELPGVWHDSWIKAYKTEGLVDWLYEQHK
jgi:predicted peptidase